MNESRESSTDDGLIAQVANRVLHRLSQPRVQPRATYRLQLDRGRFGFREAAAIVPYLHALGISHVYASPFLMARTGSSHGYDVVDHTRIDPALGGDDEFRKFVDRLHEHGLGLIMDLVPNHMGIVSENKHWNDVLENGPCSSSAIWFDIDWDPINPVLKNRLLLPLLGEQYGSVLEAGEIRVEYDAGAFYVRYFDNRLPADPKSYARILSPHLEEFLQQFPEEDADRLELESILTAIDYLPEHTETDPERIVERNREKEVIKTRLHRLVQDSEPVARFLDANLSELNGTPDRPESFDALDQFLSVQVFRLAHWKSAGDEINYRRFFDINELAAICMEEPVVFEATHRLVFELLARGDVDGLRIDHIDGLYDPRDYLWRLHWGYLRALGKREWDHLAAELPASVDAPPADAHPRGEHDVVPTPEDEHATRWQRIEPEVMRQLWQHLDGPEPRPGQPWHDEWLVVCGTGENRRVDSSRVDFTGGRLPLEIFVEKILEGNEPLPTWPVAGTTGYEFLNLVNGLFVNPAGLREVERKYRTFTENRAAFAEVAYDCKRLTLKAAMSGEAQMLGYRLDRLSELQRRARDYTLNNLTAALREILACFPVYRTYLVPDRIAERDRRFLELAVRRAKRRNPAMEARLFDFVRDTLLFEQPPEPNERMQTVRRFLVGRFQQTSSAVMAKSVEDTAFYRFFPLVSLNEVGGAPEQSLTPLERFHEANAAHLRLWPTSMLASTTHDTKRSEDVRARIDVLSEIPRDWGKAITRWARLNRKLLGDVDGEPAPSRNDEYLFYQTLIGIAPISELCAAEALSDRLQGYMEKATHEAKLHTSWISPVPRYDDAIREFVASTMRDEPRNRFLGEVRAFSRRIDDAGFYTALSQVFLKLTSPGVPDIYQGQEFWDFSLVDPDNRRPVDFERRATCLAEIERASADSAAQSRLAEELVRHPHDERMKLFVTWTLLQFRQSHPEVLISGDYFPLAAEGTRQEHVCAFAWRWRNSAGEERLAIAIAPRLLGRLMGIAEEPEGSSQPPLGSDVWEETAVILDELAGGPLRDVFTHRELAPQDGRIELAEALARFPVALLTNA